MMAVALSAIILSPLPSARADNIIVTIRAAREVAPLFVSNATAGQGICEQNNIPAATCFYGVESFASFSANQAGQGFVSTFSTGQNDWTGANYITGAYSGQLTRAATNQYGGAQGSVAYPTASGIQTYKVAFTPHGVPGVNYFGIWITAMDATNLLKLHTDDNSVLNFTTNTLRTYLSSTATPASYNGNPTASFLNQNSGEPYAYVNFYNIDGYFTSVDFSNSSGSGFESSNHAVGYFDPIFTEGTQVLEQATVPEPASTLLLLSAVGAFAWFRAFKHSDAPGPASPAAIL